MKRVIRLSLIVLLFAGVLGMLFTSNVTAETMYNSYYLRDGDLAVYPLFLPPDTSYFIELPTYTSPMLLQFAVFNCSSIHPLYIDINGNLTEVTREGVYSLNLENTANRTIVIHFVLYTKNKILLSSTFYLEPEPKTPAYLKFLPEEFQRLLQQIKLQQIMFGMGAGLVGVYYSIEIKKKTRIKAYVGYIALIAPALLGFVIASSGIIEGYHFVVLSTTGIVTYQLSRDYASIYSILTISKGAAKQKHRILVTDIPVSDDFQYVLYPTIILRPFQLISKKRLIIEDDYPIYIDENPGILAEYYEEKEKEFFIKGDPAFTELLIDHGILKKRTLELEDLQKKFREISIAFDLLSDRKAWRQFEAYRKLRDKRFEEYKGDLLKKVREEMRNE